MRRVSLALGIVTLAAVWAGPLPRLAPHSFSAHMTMHMGVVAIAAPLLALGVAGTRYDLAGRYPVLQAPVQASIVELVVVWAWHAPALHHAARHTQGGLLVEQGMFLVTGLLLWLAAFSARPGPGLIGLLLTSMHMTLLGALLALTPRALYAHDAGAGLTPLDDQHLGGAIMLLVGGASYLIGGLALTVRLLRPHALSSGEHA